MAIMDREIIQEQPLAWRGWFGLLGIIEIAAAVDGTVEYHLPYPTWGC